MDCRYVNNTRYHINSYPISTLHRYIPDTIKSMPRRDCAPWRRGASRHLRSDRFRIWAITTHISEHSTAPLNKSAVQQPRPRSPDRACSTHLGLRTGRRHHAIRGAPFKPTAPEADRAPLFVAPPVDRMEQPQHGSAPLGRIGGSASRALPVQLDPHAAAPEVLALRRTPRPRACLLYTSPSPRDS